jgi:hypothetical protein
MTRPTTYLIRMLLFLAAVATLVGVLLPRLLAAFANNPPLNALILAVLAAGIAWNLYQVVRLAREVRWIDAFRIGPERALAAPQPSLLAPMATMLAPRDDSQKRRLTLSAAVTRGLLDSLASRLDESRELSRYATGLLIFLGLLGTFWGLLLTVSSVSDVIGGLSVGSGDINAMFEQLKAGLARPLHGMGTAFSSSMFGLSGALVLGFLDLTAGQAQNRFFNELEEWLAGLTRVSSGALGDGEAPIPVYVQALLEQTAENLESLQRVITRGEESRDAGTAAIMAMAEKLATLAESLRDEAGTAQLLRNIDATLQRMSVEMNANQARTAAELRQDVRLLARTIAGRVDAPQ